MGFARKLAGALLRGCAFYFFGMMLNAIASMAVTGLDIVSTIRDLGASISQGNVIGAILNALSLVPVLGAIEGASDLVKTAQKWLDAVPSKADEVLGFLNSTILTNLPDWIGGKLLGLVSDAPVSKLVDEGIPVEDIVKYSDEGVDFQKVLELRRQDIPPEDIRYYVENDFDLSLISKLRAEGMPANRIRFRLGDGAKKAIGDLRSQGLSRNEIVEFIDEGADLKKVSKLRSQGMSTSDIKYLVREDISLGAASTLRKIGVNPGRTKKLLKVTKWAEEVNKITVSKRGGISNKELRWINKKIAGEHKLINKKTVAIAAAANEVRSWKKETQNSRSRRKERSTRINTAAFGNSYLSQ